MKKVVLGCMAILAAVPAFAEEPARTESKLDEMVVTATRTEKSIADAPGSVSVVTAEEMKKRKILSVDEAVNLLPGVFDNRIKGLMGTTSSITFRGMPSQGRTLIMMDGMPVNDAYSGAAQYGGIRTEDLSRIEVVRGPSSSLYGGNAMGGVIHMLSLMPDKREFNLSSGYGGGHPTEGAMKDLYRAYGSYGDKLGKFRLFASLGYQSTDGYPTGLVFGSKAPVATSGITGYTQDQSSTGAARYLVGDTGNNGWWDYSAAVRLQYDFSADRNIRLSWLRAASKYSYDTPHTYLTNASGAPVYTYKNPTTATTSIISESSFLSGDGSTVQDTYSINAETMIGSAKAKWLFGINDQGENWYNTPSGATLAGGPGTKSDSPNRTYFSDLQVSVPVMEKHVLTGGVSFKYDTADSKNLNLLDYKNPDSVTGTPTQWGGGVSTTYSAYLQAEISLLDSLTLFAGARDDYWTLSDGYAGFTGTGAKSETFPEKSQNAFSPKGALVWKPIEGTTVRASGGKAFRAPGLNQLFKSWISSSTLTAYNSNPNMNPETVLSWDFGVEQKLWSGAKAKATYFENHISDMIYYLTSGTSVIAGKTYTNKDYNNVGGAVSRGAELELEQKFGKDLRLFAGYTYIDSYITEYKGDSSYVGKSLNGVPRHMINGGVDAAYGPLSAFLVGRYVSKRYNDTNTDTVGGVYGSYDEFFTADIKTSLKATDWATVSVSVDNILDRKYYVYYPAPGRSYFANLALKF